MGTHEKEILLDDFLERWLAKEEGLHYNFEFYLVAHHVLIILNLNDTDSSFTLI